jgi:hypothetical protein
MIYLLSKSRLIIFVFALIGIQACEPATDINGEIMRCDTADVNRIEISQNAEQTIHQKQHKGDFWVNNSYEADAETVRKFLQLPSDMIIKMPAAKSDNDSLKAFLENSGIDIRFYDEDDLLCHWYAAAYNDKYKASPFMNAGADRVFFVELAGVNFDFTDRCRANPDFWVDKKIIALDYFQIGEIGLRYFGADSLKSFRLLIQPDTVFLYDDENMIKKNIDLKAVGQYLTYFDEVNFFKTVTDLSRHKQDSIIASQPIFKLEVKDTDGRITQVKLFAKQNETLNRRHKHLAYVQLNDEQKLRTVKYFAFDLLMKKPDYFIQK